MGHAYTPGLKVARATLVQKERRLPIKGEVLVKPGDRVKARDVVLRAQLPGNVVPINLAGKLGVPPQDLPKYLLVKEGDKVEEGQPIARSSGFFGLFKTTVEAPSAGTIESISTITGQLILRQPPTPVEAIAYIDGKVVEVVEGEMVKVEAVAAFVQGIFGVGGERIGTLRLAVSSPDEPLRPEGITEDMKGAVIVGGSYAGLEALERAREVGAAAVVVGGTDDAILRELLGYDLGVAITGNEQIGITLILTEGFGRLTMAKKTFELLRGLEGKEASVNGATQIRAGVIRPEVIVPLPEGTRPEETKTESGVLEVGSLVRVIREPYFGQIGRVVELPPQPIQIETETKVRVLVLELQDGRRVTIPRANVELIEE